MNLKELTVELEKIVTINLEIPKEELECERFLIIYDRNCPLAERLLEGYTALLPKAKQLDYYSVDTTKVIEKVDSCAADDLVILIESSSFRMSNFRWRLELFNRGLRVIEHAHLGGNKAEETETYLETLRYDGEYFHKLANGLVERIARAKDISITGENGSKLSFSGPFEEGKKNLGDFKDKKNKGSGFPIGEVFSELVDISKVNGEMEIFAFADTRHLVVFPEPPFVLKVVNGVVFSDVKETGQSENWQDKWKEVWTMLSGENADGKVRMRELGLALNRAISREIRLTDISAYERLCGAHISLGLKHDIYRGKMAEGINERYHVDIFPVAEQIWINEEKIYEKGRYLI